MKVGEPALAIPNGMPVGRDLDHALGYLFSREKFKGKLAEAQAHYPTPESQCPEADGLHKHATPMEPEDLSGGLIILGFLLLTALLVHFCGEFGWISSEMRPMEGKPASESRPSRQSADDVVLKALSDLETARKADGSGDDILEAIRGVEAAVRTRPSRRMSTVSLEDVKTTVHKNQRCLKLSLASVFLLVIVCIIIAFVVRIILATY